MLRDRRLTVIHAVLVLFAAAIVGRSAYVQLWQRGKWNRLADRQHFARSSLGAPRGDILDLGGVSLARTQVRVRLAVVPAEVKEPRRLAKSLAQLGVDRATLRRVADKARKWVPINRAFLPSDVAPLQAMRGVHGDDVVDRVYAPSDGLRRIVGRTDANGAGVDGLELMLDSLLRGERGTAKPLMGPKGERYESTDMLTSPPRPGHTVTLTISASLQDICDRALADATTRFSASGGDLVVLDPRSGEVRCLASRRSASLATGSTALTEPFEPGSTLKPFLAGHLIESQKARVDEVVETYNGSYTTHGRTITDVHKAERLSLADVIRYSSNVGIVRFTERLTRDEMFTTLRDFGFGTPTGVPYPSEAAGTLREPRFWSAQSQASVAIGYELAVTPLQLAAAYASIANGGVLLAPSLVREIRDADGNIVYQHQPTVVRRVLQPRTTETLRRILASVVDSGTATDASLSSYELGGKSGTARRATGGSYGTGSYTSTFVALFPAREPQYVVLVKLDDPRGTYYGGKAAAPVAKAVIEAAIAAPGAALDRTGLAMQKAKYVPPPDLPSSGGRGLASESASTSRAGTADVAEEESAPASPFAVVDSTPEPGPLPPARFDVGTAHREAKADTPLVAVPDIRLLPLRAAVRELHRAGLRVAVATGDAAMLPLPGTAVRRGTLVRLVRR